MNYSQEELNKLSTQIFWMTRRLAEERYNIEWDEEFRKVANFAFNMGITAERNKDEIPMVTYYTATLNAVSREERPYTASKEEIEEWRSELDKTLNKCKKQDKDLCEKIGGMLSKNTQE